MITFGSVGSVDRKRVLLPSLCLCVFGAVQGAMERPPDAPVAEGRVQATRHGDKIFVRSVFAPDKDLVIRVAKGANGQINFDGTFLIDPLSGTEEEELGDGVQIHGARDDVTPWHINGTYIGANHGCSDSREALCPRHGLTTVDLGSEWLDAASNRFALIKIVDDDRFWFLGENRGKGEIWAFNKLIKGTNFTNTARGRTLTCVKLKMTQLYPSCRIARQAYLVDGKTPLADHQTVLCDYLDIAEEYDIINTGALRDDIVKHPGEVRDFTAGHLDAVISNNIVYRFHGNGAVVIDHRARALQSFTLDSMGFIQSVKLIQGAYDTHEYYIPKTLPFEQDGTRYDFRALQDFRQLPPPLTLNASNKRIEYPDNPPDRFIHLLGVTANGATRREVGYAFGYSLLRGLSRPAERARQSKNALTIWRSAKTYPMAIDAQMGNPIAPGTEFHCVAYRHYFNPLSHPNATCVYWYRDDGAVIIHADYHKSVARDAIALPPGLAGRPVEIVEKTPAFTLAAPSVGKDGTIGVSVADGYGYGVLRVADPAP